MIHIYVRILRNYKCIGANRHWWLELKQTSRIISTASYWSNRTWKWLWAHFSCFLLRQMGDKTSLMWTLTRQLMHKLCFEEISFGEKNEFFFTRNDKTNWTEKKLHMYDFKWFGSLSCLEPNCTLQLSWARRNFSLTQICESFASSICSSLRLKD